MRIAFPVQDDIGIDRVAYSHFGSGNLPVIEPRGVCGGHGKDGGCAH